MRRRRQQHSAKERELLQWLAKAADFSHAWSETEKKKSLSTLAWLATGTSYRSSDAAPLSELKQPCGCKPN
jgi:hypothetical protein